MELLVKGKPHVKCMAGVSLAVPGYVYLGANPLKVGQRPQFFQGNSVLLLLLSFALLSDKAAFSWVTCVEGQLRAGLSASSSPGVIAFCSPNNVGRVS